MCGTNAADYAALQEALVRILVLMASILIAKAMLLSETAVASLREKSTLR